MAPSLTARYPHLHSTANRITLPTTAEVMATAAASHQATTTANSRHNEFLFIFPTLLKCIKCVRVNNKKNLLRKSLGCYR